MRGVVLTSTLLVVVTAAAVAVAAHVLLDGRDGVCAGSPAQRRLVLAGRNRRVAGLRRSEVADLAGVSVEYYAQLERGNLRGVLEGVLDALARALQLDLSYDVGTARRPRPVLIAFSARGDRRGVGAAGAGHDERALGLPARRAGGGLLGGTAEAHRHPQKRRGPAGTRPDHGRHPDRAGHRPGHRRRCAGRGGDRHPRHRPHRPRPHRYRLHRPHHGRRRHHHHHHHRRRRRRRDERRGGGGGRARPHPRPASVGGPGRVPGAAVVAAVVHRLARRPRRRRPHPPPVRRRPGGADRLPRQRPVPGAVLRRPRPRHRPHRGLPGRWADQLHQRPHHLRALQPGPRDARLGRAAGARRVRRAAAHRGHHHPDRAHLHQPRRPGSPTSTASYPNPSQPVE
jgi:transcriptional regulator with XRE-family HTH domain